MINNLEIFTAYLFIAGGFFIILFVVFGVSSIFYSEYKHNQEFKNYRLCHFPYKPVPKYMIKNHSQYSQCTTCESICTFCNRPQGICSRYTHKH
jgi:hypothetical protein